MAQSFLTYDQQIEKLINDKNLIISDKELAIFTLKEIGYFALISGYKGLFKNKTTKNIKMARALEIFLHYINLMKT